MLAGFSLPWCFEARATPAQRSWMVMHVDDEPPEALQFAEAYWLLELGDWANASTESPSYCTNTHALQSHEPTAQPHLSLAADQ